MKEKTKKYRPLLLPLLLPPIIAFGAWHTYGIYLVGDMTACAVYGVAVLLLAALFVILLRLFVAFYEDRLELRQGYLFAREGEDANKSKESYRSPLVKTVIRYSDIEKISTRENGEVTRLLTDGGKYEISFFSYFSKKILQRLSALKSEENGENESEDNK